MKERKIKTGDFFVGRSLAESGLILLLVMFTSCKNDSTRTASKVVDDLEFVVDFQPFSAEAGQMNELNYFKVELRNVDDIDIVDYLSSTSNMKKEEVLYYFSYRLQNDIFLLEQDTKKESILFHFERSFDLKNSRVFNVGFEPESIQNKEVTLLIDSDFLNVGPVKLKFKS